MCLLCLLCAYYVFTAGRIVVEIEHPENPKVKDFGFKWCAVPTITNFNLRLAGVDFTCCPFNGWFMDLEIARNLTERYGALEKMVTVFPELLKRKNSGDNSWRESMAVELSRAVFHSFRVNKMTMVDKTTAVKQFEVHCSREREVGNEVPITWSWIGGMLGPLFSPWGKEGRDFVRNPQYEYLADKFVIAPHKLLLENKHVESGENSTSKLAASKANALRILEKGVPTVVILYGSETGTSETFAKKLASILGLLNPTVATLNTASTPDGRSLLQRDVVLIISSTFGDGAAPSNASHFFSADSPPFPDMNRGLLLPSKAPVRLSVCAIGSTAYPNFASYGRKCWFELKRYGAVPLVEMVVADEMAGQSEVFNNWAEAVKKVVMPAQLESALRIIAAPKPTVMLRSIACEGATDESTALAIEELTRRPFATEPSVRACRVIANHELRQEADHTRSTHRVEIDVSSYGDGSYVTGDHISIVPIRSADEIVAICKALGVTPLDRFELVDCSEILVVAPEEEEEESEVKGVVVSEGVSEGVRESEPQAKKFSVASLISMFQRKKEVPATVAPAVVTEQLTPSSPLPPPTTTTAAAAGDGGDVKKDSSEEVIIDGDHSYVVKGLSSEKPYNGITWAELFACRVETNLIPTGLSDVLELLIAAVDRTPRTNGNTPAPACESIESIKKELAANVNAPDQMKTLSRKNGVTSGVTSSTEQMATPTFIDRFVTLCALLSEFPGLACRINLAKLVMALQKPKQRFYSISSSNLRSPSVVAITVGLMYEKTPLGAIRKGVCSSYLHRLHPDDLVVVALRTSSFRLPSNPSVPIVCVGPGTGFAPFAGFLDERLSQVSSGVTCGMSMVFTGARTYSDMIYLSENTVWEQGGNAHIKVAVSQEGNKERVQAVMTKNSSEIISILLDQKGYYYCCGDARVADEINLMLVDLICKEKGISKVKASAIVNSLRDEGRVQLDCWGVVSFFSKNSIVFNDKRANTAKNWLLSMQSN